MSDAHAPHQVPWPDLSHVGRWPATHDLLHLTAQMLGKLRLAVAPAQPEWFGAPLVLGARGLTTGSLPAGAGSMEAVLDVVDSAIHLMASDGRTVTVPLLPDRSIADIWTQYVAGVRELGVEGPVWDRPQERADSTPFAEDGRPRDYDPALAASWFRLLSEVHAAFDAWRSPFYGRTGIGFWWGGFDLSVVLFNGRRATPRSDADYIMRYDLDAEQLVVGFWPGTDERDAQFFGYLVPEPPGCDVFQLASSGAGWAPAVREWVLPYASVRASADPRGTLDAFLATMYDAAGALGGWDLEAFTYTRPPRPSPAAREALERERR